MLPLFNADIDSTHIHAKCVGEASSYFICPSKTGRIMSCPPSLRLSGRPSVRPLTFRVRSTTLLPFKIFS